MGPLKTTHRAKWLVKKCSTKGPLALCVPLLLIRAISELAFRADWPIPLYLDNL